MCSIDVLNKTIQCICRMKLEQYLKDSVRKVVVSAPVKDSEGILNIVLGCNQVYFASCNARQHAGRTYRSDMRHQHQGCITSIQVAKTMSCIRYF